MSDTCFVTADSLYSVSVEVAESVSVSNLAMT